MNRAGGERERIPNHQCLVSYFSIDHSPWTFSLVVCAPVTTVTKRPRSTSHPRRVYSAISVSLHCFSQLESGRLSSVPLSSILWPHFSPELNSGENIGKKCEYFSAHQNILCLNSLPPHCCARSLVGRKEGVSKGTWPTCIFKIPSVRFL